MDILAARKKAAERSKKKAETIESPPAATHEQEPVVVPSATAEAPVPAPPMAAPEAANVRQPAPERAAVVPVEAANVDQPPAAEQAAPAIDDGEDIFDAGFDEEEASEPAVRETETLAIRLGSEDYLVPVERVREVLKIREATPVPHAMDHVSGMISLRGTVLPVIDLAKRLGLGAGVRDDKSRIVVAGLDDEEVGLIVDRVTGVVRFLPGAVEPVPETVEQGIGAEYLSGIVRREGKLYILLDLEKAAGK